MHLFLLYSFSGGGDDIKGGGLGRHLRNVSQKSLLLIRILEIDAFIYSVYLFTHFKSSDTLYEHECLNAMTHVDHPYLHPI